MELGFHVEMRGDHMGLVYSAGAGAADVDFLQCDDVGLAFGDDGGDARGIEPAVGAEAAVNVVGEETYPLSHRLRNTQHLLFVPVGAQGRADVQKNSSETVHRCRYLRGGLVDLSHPQPT